MVLVIGLFIFSICSCFSLGRLYLFKNVQFSLFYWHIVSYSSFLWSFVFLWCLSSPFPFLISLSPLPFFLNKSKPGFSNTWTVNFLMFKLVLEKEEEPGIKLPTSPGSWKKQERSRKTSISALLTMPKPLTVWITINCGKFWKTWEYQTTWSASWEICMQVRKQQLELDMEQQTGSK